MKNIKKSALILWIVAALFFVISFSFIASGEFVNLITGIIIAGIFAFIGYRVQTNAHPSETSPSKSAQEYTEQIVWLNQNTNVYHTDKNCRSCNTSLCKEIQLWAMKNINARPCKSCENKKHFKKFPYEKSYLAHKAKLEEALKKSEELNSQRNNKQ